MNGKKAKILRKLAGVGTDLNPTQYRVMEGTPRRKFFEVPSIGLNEDGTTNMRKVEFITFTLIVDAGSRFIYKSLKKMYQRKMRNGSASAQQLVAI